MSNDTSVIVAHRFCTELAEELNFAIEIRGNYFRLVELPQGNLAGAFQNPDDLYNYLLGYRDGRDKLKAAAFAWWNSHYE